MSESTTERLNKRLRSISKEDFSDYLFQLKQAPSLYDFFNLYMKKHHLSMAEIIKNSLIARNYGYEINRYTYREKALERPFAGALHWGSHESGIYTTCTSDCQIRRIIL